MDTIMATLGRVAPNDVMDIIRTQVVRLTDNTHGGLLTLGMLGALWTTSTGLTSMADALNQAYDIKEGRPWWRVRLIAIALTVALAIFIVISTVLVLVGPDLAEKVAGWIGAGEAFALVWKIVQWPLVFAMVSFAVALIYYYAPDAEQEWIWITPGSLLATTLWLAVSIGFRFYVQNFGNYNATYGAIGGVIVLLLWFYLSALAVLMGAELNAELEHASPYGKNSGETVAAK
jgi:membrane protein